MAKVNIVRVERNSFCDAKGKTVSYCKLHCLVPTLDTENSSGHSIETYTTKYENYDVIKNILKANKVVDLQCEFTKRQDGLYKAKPVKIDEIDL